MAKVKFRATQAGAAAGVQGCRVRGNSRKGPFLRGLRCSQVHPHAALLLQVPGAAIHGYPRYAAPGARPRARSASVTTFRSWVAALLGSSPRCLLSMSLGATRRSSGVSYSGSLCGIVCHADEHLATEENANKIPQLPVSLACLAVTSFISFVRGRFFLAKNEAPPGGTLTPQY